MRNFLPACVLHVLHVLVLVSAQGQYDPAAYLSAGAEGSVNFYPFPGGYSPFTPGYNPYPDGYNYPYVWNSNSAESFYTNYFNRPPVANAGPSAPRPGDKAPTRPGYPSYGPGLNGNWTFRGQKPDIRWMAQHAPEEKLCILVDKVLDTVTNLLDGLLGGKGGLLGGVLGGEGGLLGGLLGGGKDGGLLGGVLGGEGGGLLGGVLGGGEGGGLLGGLLGGGGSGGLLGGLLGGGGGGKQASVSASGQASAGKESSGKSGGLLGGLLGRRMVELNLQ